MTDFLKVLPLAVVMVAGPQIITAIMLATSVRPRANSSGYVGGAMLAAVFNTCLFFFLARALGLAAGGEPRTRRWTGCSWSCCWPRR